MLSQENCNVSNDVLRRPVVIGAGGLGVNCLKKARYEKAIWQSGRASQSLEFPTLAGKKYPR